MRARRFIAPRQMDSVLVRLSGGVRKTPLLLPTSAKNRPTVGLIKRIARRRPANQHLIWDSFNLRVGLNVAHHALRRLNTN